MYVHPGKKVIYLAHPRTASTATGRTLIAGCDFKSTHDHHARLERCEELYGFVPDEEWTIITTVRHHPDALVSHWYASGGPGRFPEGPTEEWFNEWAPGSPFYRPGSLYFHVPDATRIWHYADLQGYLDAFYGEFGFPRTELLKWNVTKDREGRPWHDYLDPARWSWVWEEYGDEMRRLGYIVFKRWVDSAS